ncbi:hypothetical protein HG537_0G03420 [Torulaspora globosa]|uniref:K Homology domain-containing protein n=1 Tax=Torulaspora globosa TaxID=48254 RepID=A0A7H9HYX8_9SACH|nr:hypothetical protein HG537_0G03420 [Torulaspora sp. CBS 2947]
MSSIDGPEVTSPNVLKRKKEDCAEELLEAEIKRVALDDDSELAAVEKENGASEDEETVRRHVHLRMLCLVKEASMIVGHKGENITNIKATTSTRINVSDNVRGVPERVVYVRGTCENVAKAFGMIVRSINDRHGEMFDENNVLNTVNLLISHHLMGCVIGKHGSRLREIEVLSAARLSASPQQLIMSNDRILSITGVADAVHIATYYVGQTIMNSNDGFKAKKAIFYQPSPVYSVLVNGASHVGFVHQKHHQYHPTDKYTSSRTNKRVSRSSPMATPQSLPSTANGSPAIYTAATAANATAFTPKFTIPNVRIVDESVATSTTHTMTIIEQEIYIDENFVGNIIGKDGKHINSIKEATGCSIYITDPVEGSLERKLIIKGTPMGSQAAIMLISNKIEIDKVNKKRQSDRSGRLREELAD